MWRALTLSVLCRLQLPYAEMDTHECQIVESLTRRLANEIIPTGTITIAEKPFLLRVCIYQARNLPVVDIDIDENGLPDPFVAIEVPDLAEGTTQTSFSNISRDTRCPQYFEIHNFPGLQLPGSRARDPTLIFAPPVKVSVFNWIGVEQSPQLLGHLHVSVHTMQARPGRPRWMPVVVSHSQSVSKSSKITRSVRHCITFAYN